MFFSFKFVVILCSLFFEIGICQLYEGDLCTFRSSRTNGTCKVISSCPSAIQSLQTQGIFPTQCGFRNDQPIVCCADDSVPGTSHITTTRTTSTAGVRTTTGTTTGVTTATGATTSPTTRRVQPTFSTTTQKAILQVGDKSKQKCQEYEQYVFETPTVTGIIGSAPLPQVHDCAVLLVENIVGGVPAKAKEFPHMALIGFDNQNNITQWECGGSLISEKFVLSAAHCTYHKTYREPKHILLGDLVLNSNEDNARPQQIPIKRIIRHREYVPPSRYHDIALFEMERAAVLGPYTKPACLNTNPNLTNRLGIASGWGQISTSGAKSTELQKVTLEMFTNTECQKKYKVDFILSNGIQEDTQLCAGSRNESRDTCQGDSGSPLQVINSDVLCSYNIIGITSFGKDCGRINLPGVYTRVSAYIKWIEDIVWL